LNQGNFSFAETNPHPPIAGVTAFPGAALVDFDNDGDLDLAEFTGSTTFGVRLNDGTGQFASASKAFANVPAAILRFADFDGDGDFDILAGGPTRAGAAYDGSIKIFLNHTISPTIAADHLTSLVDGSQVELRWPPRLDFGNGAPLTYNLRVGTSAGGIDTVSPLSNPTTGKRLVAAPGNMGFARLTHLRNLPPGTYHWSIQAVDPAWVGSSFTPEATFVIPPSSTPPLRITSVQLLPAGPLQISASSPIGSAVVIEISSDLSAWLPISTNPIPNNSFMFTDPQPTTSHRFYRARLIP
jgi:hypothetical protein